jgi:hypothetical protein
LKIASQPVGFLLLGCKKVKSWLKKLKLLEVISEITRTLSGGISFHLFSRSSAFLVMVFRSTTALPFSFSEYPIWAHTVCAACSWF